MEFVASFIFTDSSSPLFESVGINTICSKVWPLKKKIWHLIGHALLLKQKPKEKPPDSNFFFSAFNQEERDFHPDVKDGNCAVKDCGQWDGLWPKMREGTLEVRKESPALGQSPGETVWNSLCQFTLSPRVSQTAWCFVHQTSSSLSRSPSQWWWAIRWCAQLPTTMVRRDHVVYSAYNISD